MLFGTTFRNYETLFRTKVKAVAHLGNVWDTARACPGHCKLFLMDRYSFLEAAGTVFRPTVIWHI